MATIDRRGFIGLTAGAIATSAVKSSVAGAAAAPARNSRLPARGEYLIRSAHLLTMDEHLGDIAAGNVHVRDGVIVALGANISAPGAKNIDARDMIVLPGFVDTHTHLWNGFLKGMIISDDPKFSYFPLTQRAASSCTPEDAYRSVRIGCAELLSSGVTTVHNWAHNMRTPAHADAEIAGLDNMGIRARHSYGWAPGFADTQVTDLADVARLQREWQPRSQLLTLGVAVRTSVAMERGSVDMGVLREEIAGARKLGLPLTMHLRPGATAALDKDGLLGPDFQLVHPLGLTADERAAIVRTQAKICTAPFGELSAQVSLYGYIQYAELAQAGAQIALSVDTLCSSGNGDFFAVMRGLLLANRQRSDLKYPLPPHRVLELATIEGARQLGIDDRTGSLTPGKRADLILVRTTDTNIAPVFDNPARALVISATVANVDTVMVDGRILRAGGKFTAVDPAQLVREATEAALGVKAKLG